MLWGDNELEGLIEEMSEFVDKECATVYLVYDGELGNGGSLNFHMNVGFKEANRIICFVKELKN